MPASPPAPSTATNENVEIITRPDGKRVRRIRKTKAKPNPTDGANDLSGFLDAQPKTPQNGGAATVSGAIMSKETPEVRKDKSLGNFLDNAESKPKNTGSASVAGGSIAASEVYIRADGKKGKAILWSHVPVRSCVRVRFNIFYNQTY